ARGAIDQAEVRVVRNALAGEVVTDAHLGRTRRLVPAEGLVRPAPPLVQLLAEPRLRADQLDRLPYEGQRALVRATAHQADRVGLGQQGAAPEAGKRRHGHVARGGRVAALREARLQVEVLR